MRAEAHHAAMTPAIAQASHHRAEDDLPDQQDRDHDAGGRIAHAVLLDGVDQVEREGHSPELAQNAHSQEGPEIRVAFQDTDRLAPIARCCAVPVVAAIPAPA